MIPRTKNTNYVLGRAEWQSRVQDMKSVTSTFAFGEFWRHLSQLDKSNTCCWHSACTKLGGLDILYTDRQLVSLRHQEGVRSGSSRADEERGESLRCFCDGW